MKRVFNILLIFLSFFHFYCYGKNVRIIWTNDPSHSSKIIWTTHKKTKQNNIYISTDKEDVIDSLERLRLPTEKNFRYRKGGEYSHQISLRNLQPNTTYFFRVVSDKKISPVFHFRTAPSSDEESFELLFGGDSRSYRHNRIAINKTIKNTFEENPKILALVHGGDFIADGDDWKQWSHWFEDYSQTTTSNGRILPIIPTRGNHEDDRRLFNEIFGWPGGRDNYYITQIGSLFLLNLNTEISIGGHQKSWLERQLRWISPRARWIIANYHRPAWPAVKSPSYAKKYWVPLFEKYSLDLAFESDGHVLKRTLPIKNEKVDHKDGVIYVGEGGLGVKQRSPRNQDAWYLQDPGYAISAYHFQKLKIENNEMEYQVILMDGNIFDTMTFSPRTRI